MKIRPVGAELFQADGRKEMTKLIVAFATLWTRLKMDVVSVGKSDVLDEGGQGNERCCGRKPIRWTRINDYFHQEILRPVEA
jgi:hypothetical protein